MPNRRTFLHLGIITLFLIVLLMTISARGCQKRGRETKIGSSNYVWAGINAPSSLVATPLSQYRIDLSWQDNSLNEDGFAIERKMWEDGAWSQIGTTTEPIYSDTELLPGIDCYYRVRGFNTIGDYSPYSNEAMTTTFEFRWLMVAAGWNHSLAISDNGILWSWGDNRNGGLGLGDSNGRLVPTTVGTESDWQAISCGQQHSLGLKSDGTLLSWGYNGYGQLGMGDTDYDNWEPIPVPRNGLIGLTLDTDWENITAGGYYSLARKTNGTIWSWGNNEYGQLGLGDSGYVVTIGTDTDYVGINRTTPTQIGAESDWSIIDAGFVYASALKINGTFWAWGNNEFGQLGIGDNLDRNTPTQIGTDTDWAGISAGAGHILAVKANGTLWAWGDNAHGKLGFGDYDNRNSPVQVNMDSDWSMVAAGYAHTIASKTGGTIWSWGRNHEGELGIGNYAQRNVPTLIGTDSNWSIINAGGYHSFAIKNNNTLWAWGDNGYGQLGMGDNNRQNLPIIVRIGIPNRPQALFATAVGTRQIDLSWWDTSNNEDGFKIERKIGQDGTWVQIATVGANITSYFDTDNLTNGIIYYYRIRAYNNYGNSYYYSYEASATPIVIPPSNLSATVVSPNQFDLNWKDNSVDEDKFEIERKIEPYGSLEEGIWETIKTVAANVINYSDINENGFTPYTIYYYRMRSFVAGFGYGTYSNEASVSFGTWSSIVCGGYHTIALRKNGSLWSWGKNSSGQLGLGYTSNPGVTGPTPINESTDWITIAAGANHTLAAKISGTLWAWGNNEYGQLGLGDFYNRNTPSQIGTDSGWSKITAGEFHTMAIKNNGTLWAWGDNNYGQLGNPDISDFTIPNQIGTNAGWSKITAGEFHTLAIKNNGSLWAWGDNSYGQLGDQYIYDFYIPNQIGTDLDWTMVAAGSEHTIGRKIDGTLWSWGYNEYGQLGFATTDDYYRPYPTQIGTNSDWSTVATGANHVVALKTSAEGGSASSGNGTLWAWGKNTDVQLGLGDTININTPAQISTVTDWSLIAAGDKHTIAIKDNNTIWAWGKNADGQLGFGDSIDRNIPCPHGSPAPPMEGACVANANSWAIRILWTDNSYNEIGFKVERRTKTGSNNYGAWTIIAILDADVTFYFDSPPALADGFVYEYRIYAYNNVGNSPYFTVTYSGPGGTSGNE